MKKQKEKGLKQTTRVTNVMASLGRSLPPFLVNKSIRKTK